jgi:dTDP-4-dehydrorhamnose 3,5-epimerase-like enzyme
MKFIKTSIPSVFIIEPSVFGDDTGYFLDSPFKF